MADPIFDVGDFAIAGWGPQTTVNTPVNASSFVAGQPGSISPAGDFNPDLQDVDILSGAPNQTVAVVPRKGDGTLGISSDFFPNLNVDFLAGPCGLGNPMVKPSMFTWLLSMEFGAYQYPNAFIDSLVVSGDAATGAMWKATGVYGGRPVPINALPAPTLQGEDPYTWEDFLGMTLVSGARSNQDVESVSLTIAMAHTKAYGDSGVALPNIRKFTGFRISGSVRLFMNDTNIAEYNAAIAKDGTAGGLSFGWGKSTGKQTTFTLPHVKYVTPRITLPKGNVNLLELGFRSFSPTLGNQLQFVQN